MTAAIKDRPLISVVVAAYQRHDALKEALSSLVDQDETRWEGLVVDDCSPEPATDVVRALGDSRLRCYRLPFRCGEQSGPNSVGLAASRGRYVAFLNHDDLLLSHHFTRVLAAMPESGRGFVLGGSATVGGLAASGTPLISLRPRPRGTKPSHLFFDNTALEPCSSWLVDRRLATLVGPWRPAAGLVRTPIQDWYLRAVRAGADTVLVDDLTTLKIEDAAGRQAQRRYDHPATLNARTRTWIRDVGGAAAADDLDRECASDAKGETIGVSSAWTAIKSAVVATAFEVFRSSGFDSGEMYLRSRGARPGAWGHSILAARTGERLPTHVALPQLLEEPDRWRVL